MTKRIIDLSHPISIDTPPFPGDPPVSIDILYSTDQSDDLPRQHLNLSRLSMCIHCGTHLDAPFHFFADRATIDRVPLQACIGQALLVDLTNVTARESIDASHLEPYRDRLTEVNRIVLNTGWYLRWNRDGYFTEHPVLTKGAARLLVDCGVCLVGVDFPSVDRSPYEAHVQLLGNDVLILENLTNLHHINAEVFELIAIPLAIRGRDGSPVRAIASVHG